MSIEIKHISKTFGKYNALDDVNLKVNDGELVALLGPSGSGKTTLLRIIAGLELPNHDERSEILFHDTSVTDQTVRQRQVGFVFQHYALFRHMTVFENIAFGLRVRPRSSRPSKSDIQDRVNHLLKLIQLENLGDRFPAQLSGGQRQRVALARALAVEPKVLLLDEPFGALDAKVRQGLRAWLRKLHDEIHLTSVLVTHDQEEALEVADRIVVMNNAKIEQVGTPEEVFHKPATRFVMEFLGQVNVFHGRAANGMAKLGDVTVDFPDYKGAQEQEAMVYMRPYDLVISRSTNGQPGFAANITRINPAGSLAKVLLTTEAGVDLQVDLTLEEHRELALHAGESVYVFPKNARVFLPEFMI